MAAITPPVYVAPPAHGPRRYGLFNAASILDLPIHGRTGGVQWEPEPCGPAYLYTAECPITNQNAKTLTDTIAPQTAAPFVVYTDLVCAPVGRTPEEQQRRVIERLRGAEQTSVEAALWNGGAVGATPNLNGAGATIVVAGAATSLRARIALLEEAFYSAYGYQGTIHVNTTAYGQAADSVMIREIGTPSLAASVPALLTTPIGSIWSFGAGYGVTGPAGVAPAAGSVWAFMTPNVTVWQAADENVPDPRQTFDRATNQMTVVAEREYAFGYDCPSVFAIEVPVEDP